jgi:hypothetical protein
LLQVFKDCVVPNFYGNNRNEEYFTCGGKIIGNNMSFTKGEYEIQKNFRLKGGRRER